MHAFLNCPNLTFVKIYEGVENTAANAFCGTQFAFTTFLDSGRAISGFSVKSSRSGRRGFPQANFRFPVVLEQLHDAREAVHLGTRNARFATKFLAQPAFRYFGSMAPNLPKNYKLGEGRRICYDKVAGVRQKHKVAKYWTPHFRWVQKSEESRLGVRVEEISSPCIQTFPRVM